MPNSAIVCANAQLRHAAQRRLASSTPQHAQNYKKEDLLTALLRSVSPNRCVLAARGASLTRDARLRRLLDAPRLCYCHCPHVPAAAVLALATAARHLHCPPRPHFPLHRPLARPPRLRRPSRLRHQSVARTPAQLLAVELCSAQRLVPLLLLQPCCLRKCARNCLLSRCMCWPDTLAQSNWLSAISAHLAEWPVLSTWALRLAYSQTRGSAHHSAVLRHTRCT